MSRSGRIRSGEAVADVGQRVADLATDRLHGGDGGDGDQRGDQRVLDGGGTLLVLHEATENGQHLYLQRKKRFLIGNCVNCPVMFWGLRSEEHTSELQSQ